MKQLYKDRYKYYGKNYKKLLECDLITECMCDDAFPDEEEINLKQYNSSTNRLLYKLNHLGQFVVADDLSILADGVNILKDALQYYLYKKVRMKYSIGLNNGKNYVISNGYTSGKLVMPEDYEDEDSYDYPSDYFEPDDRSSHYQSPLVIAINKFKNRNYDEVY